MSREFGRVLASVGLAFTLSGCVVDGSQSTSPVTQPTPDTIPRHQFRESWLSPSLVRAEWNGHKDNGMVDTVLTKMGARHHLLAFDEADEQQQPFLYILVDRNKPAVDLNLKMSLHQRNYSINQLAGNLYKVNWGRGAGDYRERMDQILKEFEKQCGPLTVSRTKANSGRYFITQSPNCYKPPNQ